MRLTKNSIIALFAMLFVSCAHKESQEVQHSDVQVVITADFATPAAAKLAAGVGAGRESAAIAQANSPIAPSTRAAAASNFAHSAIARESAADFAAAGAGAGRESAAIAQANSPIAPSTRATTANFAHSTIARESAANFAAAGVGAEGESAVVDPTAKTSAKNSAKSATQATRVTTIAFESGDLLGLYAVKSGGELNAASNLINNHQLKVGANGAIIGVDAPAYYPDKSSSLDLFSYYPYQSGNATADALGVLVGIRTTQTDFSLLQASDLCYGQKLDAAPSAAPHPLQFIHSFAQLRLNFSLYEGCSAIASIKLLSIKDSAKLNLQTGAVTLLPHTSDVDPYVGSLGNSADATVVTTDAPANPLQFTAIIPTQSLSGACVEITLTDGTIYYYHATTPIALRASATNTLNLTLSDKGKLTLASAPAITAWGVEAIASNISQATDNEFTFYWSPAITSFASIDKAFITLTNPTTKRAARIEATAFVRDAISTAENATFRFAITRADAESMGYPVSIDKLELFNGTTLIHTLTDYYGRTVTKAGAHTFGTVTSLKLAPGGDWLGAANTAQSRAVVVSTTGSTSWIASASGAGLTVSPASGSNSATATIKWAAQLTTGDSPARSGTVTFTTVPAGVTYVLSTSQLMGPYYLAVNPSTAWANVANTAQSRSHAIATGNLAGWTATATSTPTAGLTVTPSGTRATPAVATWAAQAVGALARSGSITFSPNPASTAAPITIATNQVAGPAPTLTLALTDAIDNPIPAGGKAYKATITSNHAWTASALTNLTIDKNKGTAGVTAVVVTIPMTNLTSARTASVVFTTNALPIGTATKTWSGTQEAFKYVNINGVKWAADDYWGAGLTWNEAQTVCPTGWRLPTTAETSMLMGGVNGVAWANCPWGLWVSTTPLCVWFGPSAKTADPTNAIKFTYNHYWTSNQHPDGNGALFAFNETNVYPSYSYPKGSRLGVRCVQGGSMMVVPAAPGEVIPKEGKSYAVTLLASGSWTTSSLQNVTVSPSSGNGGSNAVTITVLPSNTATTRSASVRFTSAGVSDQTWAGTQAAAPANSIYINGIWWSKFNVGSSTTIGFGTHHAWGVATTTPAALAACPSGWRLPTHAEYVAMHNAGLPVTYYNNGSGWSASTPGWVRYTHGLQLPAAGHRSGTTWNVPGVVGHYWTSTAFNSSNAYNIGFGSGDISPSRNHSKLSEFSVRCVQ